MSNIFNLGFTLILMALFFACKGQKSHHEEISKAKQSSKKIIGGPFENGTLIYVDMPDQINSVDTSSGWDQDGQKILINGTIYKRDGKTPASGVILYYYHTDVSGRYISKKGMNEKAKIHGYIRGWVESDEEGKYEIYTVRPAPYPSHNEAAHIHLTIKEPTIEQAYYIDNLVFDDDVLLSSLVRKKLKNRGGSGILRFLKSGDLKVAKKDIILGLNIPNYPEHAK